MLKWLSTLRAGVPALTGAAVLAAATFAVAPARAHHSFAQFDTSKMYAITGTVKEWVWANPHSWLYLIVAKADGSTQEWAIEASSPNMMIRWGWNQNDVKVGDKVTVDAHPSRDGKPIASIYAVYTANGKVLADPMGRRTTGEDIAGGPPPTPTKPTGVPLP